MDTEEYLAYKPPHSLCVHGARLLLALSYLTSTVSISRATHTLVIPSDVPPQLLPHTLHPTPCVHYVCIPHHTRFLSTTYMNYSSEAPHSPTSLPCVWPGASSCSSRPSRRLALPLSLHARPAQWSGWETPTTSKPSLPMGRCHRTSGKMTSPGSGRPTKTPTIAPVASGSRALDAPSATKVRRRPHHSGALSIPLSNPLATRRAAECLLRCTEVQHDAHCSTSEHAIFLSACHRNRPSHRAAQ